MRTEMEQVIACKKNLLDQLCQTDHLDMVQQAAQVMTQCLRAGNKILLAGNGGSAADAQHFAGEIVGRFCMERRALPAISLCVDPSVMTCIGNDYGYDMVFERQLSGLGNAGDVFVPISTSGNSINLVHTVKTAKKMGIWTIGLLGKTGGKLKELCDYALVVPSEETPRIQEIHTFSVHMLCESIEKQIFEKSLCK